MGADMARGWHADDDQIEHSWLRARAPDSRTSDHRLQILGTRIHRFLAGTSSVRVDVVQERGDLVGRHGLGVEPALGGGAAHGAQVGGLLGLLDALSGDADA